MEYNSQRSKMNISEYGRNIQKMIEQIRAIEDREKRNQQARAIIQVMGQLNPHLRDVNDFKHKLWDHLFIMADFNLDVDSPYPIPSAETINRKPQLLGYATNNVTFKHYGRHIERMIEKACEFPEGQEKDILINLIANHLKKSYLTWNKEVVTDEEIIAHLNRLSKGRLVLANGLKLNQTRDILQNNNITVNPNLKNKKKKFHPPKQMGKGPHFKSKKKQG